MPELPDIQLYLHALRPRVVGRVLERVRVVSPFVLRTFDPPIDAIEGRRIIALRRIGKRIVLELETRVDESEPLFLVIHLMIAGRFRWDEKIGVKPTAKIGLAAFTLDNGTLQLVEPSPKKRAAIHIIRGEDSLNAMNPGGIDLFTANVFQFSAQLRKENHTIKRSLTDPRLIDGVGNAYSDEILHAAKLSPIKLTSRMTDDEIDRLFNAARSVLSLWTQRLTTKFATKFPGPGDVTAFRPDFAVHGKYDQPCPVCGTAVQRIRYAENETNYCPRCQTDGKVLADRSLSRLLKDDWPSTIEEWEAS